MIRNSKVKVEIAQDWAVVRKLCEGSHRQALIPGGFYINETRPEDSYNLPLVLGYAVLDRVLSELRDQRAFSCKAWQLGKKMAASQNVLPWRNYDLVNAGKEARNNLAHEAKLLSKGDCLRYIAAIESELKAWRVI
jgi:hypothetical protein